ncbi:hypothetical protein MRX96_021283 [Rhipicephalus microplus]
MFVLRLEAEDYIASVPHSFEARQGRMKHIIATICVMSLVAFAANAERQPEDDSLLDETFKDVERDAAHIGEIHREGGTDPNRE